MTAGGSGGAATGGSGGTGAGGSSGVSGVPQPAPPAGLTLCGQATFTAADATAACNSTPLLGGLHPSYPAQCSMTQSQGGQYKAYCSKSSLEYLWVRFNQLAITESDCSMFEPALAFSSGELHYGAYDTSVDLAAGTPTASVSIASTPQDVGMDFSFSGNGPKGTGTLWLAADGYCGVPASAAHATITGINFAWSAP